MHTFSQAAACHVCGDYATLEILDEMTGTKQYWCENDSPKLPVGQCDPRIKLLRHRLGANNPFSHALLFPFEHPSHKNIYSDLCEYHLLGNYGKCRYYLSMITGIDHFALWTNEYVVNTKEYVLTQTSGTASCFVFDSYTVDFMTPLLKKKFVYMFEKLGIKMSKCEDAIVLRLKHPDWSDEQIANAVPTTVKQLNRCSDYKVFNTKHFRTI
jgi:hypothetical protein